MPNGYRHDRHVAVLGQGDGVFERAADGVRRWEAHRGAGMTLRPDVPELREGATMIQALTLPLVSAVAACRIVYLVDEADAFGARQAARANRAYQTLMELQTFGVPRVGDRRVVTRPY